MLKDSVFSVVYQSCGLYKIMKLCFSAELLELSSHPFGETSFQKELLFLTLTF